MLSILQHYAAMRRFQKLPASQRRIVFYSEGPASWPHLGPIAQELLQHGETLCWLSSHADDPGLKLNHPHCLPFYIGDGAVRIITFTALDCGVLLTTSPDLDQNQIKRSRFNPVYVYVHHSLVSHHMVYRPKAFAAFDAVLCAGPYHVQELELEEARYGIAPRKKLAHGYGRLDQLMAQHEKQPPEKRTVPHILIAPSWGPDGLIEGSYVQPLLQALFTQGYTVTLRPHPRSFQFAADKINALIHAFPSLVLDTDIVSDASLLHSDVLISDWSGAALEYAFARLRPVLFIDTPRKINNPHYQDIEVPPLEVRIREKIGAICAPGNHEAAMQMITKLIADQPTWEEKIRQLRSQTVFHAGSSAQAARQEILGLLPPLEQEDEQRRAG